MEQELLKKLRYKEGRAAILNAPEGYSLGIEQGESADLAEGPFDFVQLFVNNAAELRAWLPRIIPALKYDALFWLTYPKQSSKVKTDLNRDIAAAVVQEQTAYRVVSNVAVDAKWSALRLRLKEISAK